MNLNDIVINPELDLVLERVVDVPVERVWRAWTVPAHLEKWFTPAPWKTSDCTIDLRPGGAMRCTMTSPEGESHLNEGCYLEVVHQQKLVFTDALGPDFRPTGAGFMTAIVMMEPAGNGTRYTAIVRHADSAAREKHEAMGFHTGWGTALDQLVAHARSM